jgi:peptide-methionine (S)-S-oxide reductase
MKNTEVAILGGGCFWCLDAVFRELRGVTNVDSGYTGGHTVDPTYHEVCGGTTGHAEVVRIEFDPDVISFRDILEVFFATHDPTTLNRQGADAGTQYRSAIFAGNEAQRATAEQVVRELTEAGVFADPIVTEITDLGTYYPGEAYHQDYYRQNATQGYCQVVISPKLARFRQRFGDRLESP